MTSHQWDWFIITSLLTGLVFNLMFWVSLLGIFPAFDRPKFCILLIFISEHHLWSCRQPACSHCIPQLANHAAFVISTIWSVTALSRSLPSSLIWTERLLWKGEERQQSVKAIGYTVPSAMEWDYESLAGWHCFDCLSSIPDFQLCFSHAAHDRGDARGERERMRPRKREGCKRYYLTEYWGGRINQYAMLWPPMRCL